MDIYRGRGKEINEAWHKLEYRDTDAWREVYDMLVGLHSRYFPILWRYWDIAFLYHEEDDQFEIVYDTLSKTSLDFMQEYMPHILMTHVDSVKAWVDDQNLAFHMR